MVTDDLAAAKKFAEDTWKKGKDAEKAMMEKIKKVRPPGGPGAQGAGECSGIGGGGCKPLPLQTLAAANPCRSLCASP
jgi:hypothetical protein